MSVPVQPDWPQPSHPHLFEVRSTPTSATEFNTSAHSLVTLPPGALFTPLTSPPLTLTRTKAYSSIQLSRTEHAELHSDLLYVNHSCEPSLIFDMAAREVRVAGRGEERGLEVGDELTFFYPSSEWSMAQPFECRCGAGEGVCKGWIGGAKEMGRERMKGMWLNGFIEELLDEQEREAEAAAATAVKKDVEATAKDGDEQPTVKDKRTERKGSCLDAQTAVMATTRTGRNPGAHRSTLRVHTPTSATEFNTSAHSLVTLPPGALFVKLTSPPLTLTTTKAYSSIQLSRNEHAELHSDLLYVNHSCEPSLVFDMGAREVRVAARKVRVASGPIHGAVEGQEEVEGEQEERSEGGQERRVVEGKQDAEEQQEERLGVVEGQEGKQEERGLQPGDELTFFYPSSEWSMAQPFECRCGAPGEGVCKGWIGGAKEMGRERMRGMWLNAFIEELLDEQEGEAAEAAAAVKNVEATATAVAKDGEARAKDVEATAAVSDVDGDEQPTVKDGDEEPTVKEERSKRTERKGSCNVQ